MCMSPCLCVCLYPLLVKVFIVDIENDIYEKLMGCVEGFANTFSIAIDLLYVPGYDLALAGPNSMETCAISL